MLRPPTPCPPGQLATGDLTQGHEGLVVLLHEVVVKLLLPLVQVLPLVLGEVDGNVDEGHRNLGRVERSWDAAPPPLLGPRGPPDLEPSTRSAGPPPPTLPAQPSPPLAVSHSIPDLLMLPFFFFLPLKHLLHPL